LDATKSTINTETKKINDSLAIVQTKLTTNIDIVAKTNNDRYEQLFLLLEKKFQTANDKYNVLDKAIQKEREERPKQIEQAVTPLLQRIESIFHITFKF